MDAIKNVNPIMCFVRIDDNGGFEKITWVKDAEGNKTSKAEPYKPSPVELREIAASPYAEIFIHPKQ